jgi:hypothetical protein
MTSLPDLPEGGMFPSPYALDVFLGDDLLPFLVLAFGGALFVGNLLAVVKPPQVQLDDTNLERAPVARSLTFALVGLVAAIWAIASLVSG